MKKAKIDIDGVVRYQSNRIVRYLLDCGGIDLNRIWQLAVVGQFNRQEMREFYKLIGYSKCGYSEIDFSQIPQQQISKY